MKKYKIKRFNFDNSKIAYIKLIDEKTKKETFVFFNARGNLEWFVKFKNFSFRFALEKNYMSDSRNYVFQNFKKGNKQGVEINFD